MHIEVSKQETLTGQAIFVVIALFLVHFWLDSAATLLEGAYLDSHHICQCTDYSFDLFFSFLKY